MSHENQFNKKNSTQKHITLHTLQKEVNDLRLRVKQLEEDVAYKQKD